MDLLPHLVVEEEMKKKVVQKREFFHLEIQIRLGIQKIKDLYNTEINKGESIRVFPISNWTEKDIWEYIKRENIPIVSLYSAKERPVVKRGSNLIMVDDERMRLNDGEVPEMKMVRFRTLGDYPLSGAVESSAVTLEEIIDETLSSVESERTSRVIDSDNGAGSMEKRKREGYF